MDHSRRLPPRMLAFLSAAALTVAGSAAPAQTGASSQVPGGAAIVPAGDPPRTDSPGETLRHAVRGRFLIGAAVSPRRLDDPKLAELVAQQFDCLTAENEFKPRSLHPRPERFDFATADRIVEFARKHDLRVVGHTLCWRSQTPSWMFRGPDGKPLPHDEALRNLKPTSTRSWGTSRGR